MTTINELFFDLIRVALGNGEWMRKKTTVEEWYGIFDEASNQAVVGILLEGIKKSPDTQRPPQRLLLE